ncbi:3'-5' exonuclease [Ramlibacter sp.]|uniref:3'-5' exonuclease n=1 Tax=Ramlibacter sp. TaxID=1917967 RepID=UPI002616BD94|nr:3'-5' exonuclease [Ramlibacter sp.]
MQTPRMPAPEEIALLPPFERLARERIALVATEAEAERAAAALLSSTVWGFDTESKPTFHAGEASEGPHVIQLAMPEQAFVFQLHDAGCRAIAGELLARAGIVKAGFGLQDDQRRIVDKLGVEPRDVLDLDTVLRQRGYRRQMGTKAAVAVLFGRRFLKSKRAATSNWSQRQLSDAQLLYAANDAWAALRVYQALGLPMA